MKELFSVVSLLCFFVVGLLLVLNGLQRIIAHGDWAHGLCNLGIGMLMLANVIGGFIDE